MFYDTHITLVNNKIVLKKRKTLCNITLYQNYYSNSMNDKYTQILKHKNAWHQGQSNKMKIITLWIQSEIAILMPKTTAAL